MEFLTKDDFDGVLSDSILNQLSGINDKNLVDAEGMAISELDPLRTTFNMETELNKLGANRNKVLVRIVVQLTAYYLYNTVIDDEIPERITANWKKELGTIEKIANGKIGSTLETLTGDDGKTVTTFRWNSNRKRTHQLRPPRTSARESI